MYTLESSYPFPVVVGYSSSTDLLKILPEREELFECLDMFRQTAHSCSFPHLPDEVTKEEVTRFLDEDEEQRDRNAREYPDMLALIFATLATGLQMGQHQRNGGKWDRDQVDNTRRRGDAFSECLESQMWLVANRTQLLLVCKRFETHRS
jgi:hypothetical protein